MAGAAQHKSLRRLEILRAAIGLNQWATWSSLSDAEIERRRDFLQIQRGLAKFERARLGQVIGENHLADESVERFA